jgi:hypothetical protein
MGRNAALAATTLALCQVCNAQFGGGVDELDSTPMPGSQNSTVALWSSVERELMKHLAGKLESTVRPVRNVKDALPVEVDISHQGINALDQDSGTMTNTFYYRLKWKNPFLAWDTSKYDIPWVKVPAFAIWTPDVAIRNQVSITASPLNGRDEVVLTNDGTVIWNQYAAVETLCLFDMASFPFDTQVCPIYIGLESSSAAQIDLSVDLWDDFVPAANMPNFTSISWLFRNVTLSTEDISWTTATENVESQTYYVISVTALRAPQFYMANGVLPTIIITFVCMLTFFLPGTMVERMGFGATCLLSVVAVMFVVADKLPTQGARTLMDQFFFTSLLINVIAMVISSYVVVLSLNASLASMKDVAGPVSDPKFLDKIVRIIFPFVYFGICVDMMNQAPPDALNAMMGRD